MVLKNFKPLLGSLVGLAALAANGCISTPFDNDAGFSGPSTGGMGQYSNTASAPPALGGGQSDFGGSENRFVSTIRGVTDSVASALTIDPQVVPASDPVHLNSNGPAVGPDLHIQAARVYESQNNAAQALSHYQSALLVSPNDVSTLLAVARLHDRNSEWVQAESYYLRASDVATPNHGVFNDLALCYARQGKPNEAISALQFAIEQEPMNVRYRNNLAAILVESRQFAEAFDQLASVHPEAVAHYNMGLLLAKKNLPGMASGHLQTALQADPTMAVAEKLLHQVHEQRPTETRFVSEQQPTEAPIMRRLPPV